MRRVARFVRRAVRALRDVGGVSLYETTAVVAMTAVVASVALPMAMDRLENAKQTKAANEIITISSAMHKFFEHTGRWPGEVEIKKAGSLTCFLQTGIPSNDPDTGTPLPQVQTLGKPDKPMDAGSVLSRPCNTISPSNVRNINDYLVRKPNASDYPNWQGPYMEPIASDPWDRAYIINVLPLLFASEVQSPTSGSFADAGGKIGFGWVLSAGPDRLLQSTLTESQLGLGSDDTGKNMGARVIRATGS